LPPDVLRPTPTAKVLKKKTVMLSMAVFFSYWSSVFSNTDATAIRCLKNKFQNPFMIEF
jgi:hypothetical protein